MAKLLKRATIIYNYIKQKNHYAITHMDVSPQQGIAEKVCSGLGITMNNLGKKDCSINLQKHKDADPRHILILAYYSMPLSAVFLGEGCLASLIDATPDKKGVQAELFAKGERLQNLIKLEHFYDGQHESKTTKDRMCFFVREKLLEVSADGAEVAMANIKGARNMLRFFVDLNAPLVDAYLITLICIEQINGKPIVLRARKLIKELHASVKELYSEGFIPHLHSCLNEVIRASFRRFEEMGLIVMRSFVNKKGSLSTFI